MYYHTHLEPWGSCIDKWLAILLQNLRHLQYFSLQYMQYINTEGVILPKNHTKFEYKSLLIGCFLLYTNHVHLMDQVVKVQKNEPLIYRCV